MQSIKEHNLKANHNYYRYEYDDIASVCNLSKNTIWKQITTLGGNRVIAKFCMQSIKEHNLKANHNNVICFNCHHVSVCNLSKNTIWKQITTAEDNNTLKSICMQSIKEHNLKANHNDKLGNRPAQQSVCNLSKNTIWKQITTNRLEQFADLNLYAIYQRTQSESKSQLSMTFQSAMIPLYAIYQRTQSESKSQQYKFRQFVKRICMQSIKEHNLKANHNQKLRIILRDSSVCNLSKNTIWKQITTSSIIVFD